MREAVWNKKALQSFTTTTLGRSLLLKARKVISERKHIQIRYHYIRERVGEGDVKVFHVPSADNLADLLTKPLPREATKRQASMLGLF